MARKLARDVRVYRVGGAVRDELLGRPVADVDWVVVGATPEMMAASGYRAVGNDFPVFLHPDTHEEHALARTERKHGTGYRGFEFFASPDVTLEEDLARRDLTINAMARGEDGTLIDPHNGRDDLARGVLRHVSPAFAEDPLRVLRVARFAARFGFAVAPETAELMRAIVASGELPSLSSERVWREIATGLMEDRPSRMFDVLHACGALAALLPEVDALYGAGGGESAPDAGAEVMRALDYAAQQAFELPVRYAVLVQDLGFAETTRAAAPLARPARGSAVPSRTRASVATADALHARGPAVPSRTRPSVATADALHARASARLADRLSARLRVPADCRDAGQLAARFHRRALRAAQLPPAALLDIVSACDALRRPQRLAWLLRAAQADLCSRPGAPDDFAPARIFDEVLQAIRTVDAGAIARNVVRDAALRRPVAANSAAADAIKQAVRRARLAALARWKRANGVTKQR